MTNKQNLIFETLLKLGLTSKKSRFLFNKKTRDVRDLKVWKDSNSGVIYIDNYYVGNKIYAKGAYRANEVKKLKIEKQFTDKENDAQRRFKSNLKYVKGKIVGDFGCGAGHFLKLVKPYCKKIVGIELQKNYINTLNQEGIYCIDNLKFLKNETLDIVFSFHAIEHLPNPIEILFEIKKKIKKGGKILIEVPHANDFLLTYLKSDSFKQFTLWSQHLILHTHESLKRILEHVGFKDVKTYGVQRYPLSNHLFWLSQGKPGGHKSKFSEIESARLFNLYEKSLQKINATDTIVALAKIK